MSFLSDDIVEYIIYLGGKVINNDNKGGIKIIS